MRFPIDFALDPRGCAWFFAPLSGAGRGLATAYTGCSELAPCRANSQGSLPRCICHGLHGLYIVSTRLAAQTVKDRCHDELRLDATVVGTCPSRLHGSSGAVRNANVRGCTVALFHNHGLGTHHRSGGKL